jgi:hypothetical protein
MTRTGRAVAASDRKASSGGGQNGAEAPEGVALPVIVASDQRKVATVARARAKNSAPSSSRIAPRTARCLGAVRRDVQSTRAPARPTAVADARKNGSTNGSMKGPRLIRTPLPRNGRSQVPRTWLHGESMSAGCEPRKTAARFSELDLSFHGLASRVALIAAVSAGDHRGPSRSSGPALMRCRRRPAPVIRSSKPWPSAASTSCSLTAARTRSKVSRVVIPRLRA